MSPPPRSTSRPDAGTRVSRLRWQRAAVLGAVCVGMVVHVVHGGWAGTTLAPLELSESLRTVHQGVVTAGALLMVAAIAATAIYGRFFCGWGCHFLAVQDATTALLGRFGLGRERAPWRALRWAPVALVVYLYGWPLLPVLLGEVAWPGLHVQPAESAWGSFQTDDLWRSMPGVPVMVATFFVGAVALVAVAGPRAFCQTACPYGVFFAGADRLAPQRITLTGACSGCNRCSEACWSGVDVLGELRASGAVRNSACMRDLDCVAVCPTGAITLSRAPLQLRPARPAEVRAPWAEEALAALLVLGGFLAFRGLYAAIPVLMALPAAVLVAVVTLRALGLRGGAAVAPTGKGTLPLRLAALSLLAFTAHSGLVRLHEARAQTAELAARAGDPSDLAEAIAEWEAARDLGVYAPTTLRSRLADLYLRRGDRRAAVAELRAVVDADPGDEGARRALAAVEGASADQGAEHPYAE